MVIAVSSKAGPLEYVVLGKDGQGQPLSPASLFPVASITKLATALAVLRLVAEGRLELDDELDHHLPQAAAAVSEGVTLRALLCHTNGLPYDLPEGAVEYGPELDWPTLARACLATPLREAPWKRVNYSNVGVGLLALVVEKVLGQPFPIALFRLVLEPLGIEGYLGKEPPTLPAYITGNYGLRAGTALEWYNSAFWRSLALPYGGLVTNAAGTLALVKAFAGQPTGFLPPALVAEATSDQTKGLAGGIMSGVLEWERCEWGLGVELRGSKTPHFAPKEAPPTSFGHAGASGCLVWYDPTLELGWAILGCLTFDPWWQGWASIGAAIISTPAR
jgi:beta-lactamase class C